MRLILLVIFTLFLSVGADAAGFGWAGSTLMSFTQAHGTEVYYFDTSRRIGTYYLWHPGEANIAVGSWTVRSDAHDFPTTICLRDKVGHDSCQRYWDFVFGTVQHVDGDVFSLSKSGHVPFVLKSARTAIRDLARRAGIRVNAEIVTHEDLLIRPSGQKGWGEWPFAVATPPTTCEGVLASAQKNTRAGKIEAITLYFHGTVMGKPCVKVDYAKVFTLLRELGDMKQYRVFLGILKQRAATGNPRAVEALSKYGNPH